MCRLKIKIRVIGKKNQEFVRFQLTPNKTRQRGKYLTTLGYWDTRQNRQTRYIVLNLYKIMYYYCYGALPNKKILNYIYLYVIDFQRLNDCTYFKKAQHANFIENEAKFKHL